METNKEHTLPATDTKLFYSVFSGTIYEVCADEVEVLDEGQIPLISRPKPSCKKCFGRGYDGFDPKRNLYPPCSCFRKHIDPTYVPKNIQVPMEKFA